MLLVLTGGHDKEDLLNPQAPVVAPEVVIKLNVVAFLINETTPCHFKVYLHEKRFKPETESPAPLNFFFKLLLSQTYVKMLAS